MSVCKQASKKERKRKKLRLAVCGRGSVFGLGPVPDYGPGASVERLTCAAATAGRREERQNLNMVLQQQL